VGGFFLGNGFQLKEQKQQEQVAYSHLFSWLPKEKLLKL
jgi:hypothetical protein